MHAGSINKLNQACTGHGPSCNLKDAQQMASPIISTLHRTIMCNADCVVSMQICTHSTWLRGFTQGVTANKQITLWATRQCKDQSMSSRTIPESFQLPLSCDSASQQATAYIYCNLADETGNRRPYRPGPVDN